MPPTRSASSAGGRGHAGCSSIGAHFWFRTIRPGPRRRDPRAHHGGGGARRRRHQPRVLLQLRRSVRVWLRHQTAAQRHVAARRDGWRAERSAHRPSVADGRDPRAHATGDRRGRHPGRVWRVVQGNPDIERLVRNRWIWLACLDADSGALWELRSTGFVPHPLEHALAVVTGELAAWYQGKRGFLHPVTLVPASRDPRTRARKRAISMMANAPLVVRARRRRIAGRAVRAAWRRVARQPSAARAVDGLARRGSMLIACAALSVALVRYGTSGERTPACSVRRMVGVSRRGHRH